MFYNQSYVKSDKYTEMVDKLKNLEIFPTYVMSAKKADQQYWPAFHRAGGPVPFVSSSLVEVNKRTGMITSTSEVEVNKVTGTGTSSLPINNEDIPTTSIPDTSSSIVFIKGITQR